MADQFPDFVRVVTEWLDDDHALRIPDTEWGRNLYAALRGLVGEAQVEWGYNYHPGDKIYTARTEAQARRWCRTNGCDGFAFKRLVVRPEPTVGDWQLLDGQQSVVPNGVPDLLAALQRSVDQAKAAQRTRDGGDHA